MSCRCGDIDRCSNDIDKVEDARKFYEKACQVNERHVKIHLNNLELNHTICITPDNISELSEAVIHSNDLTLQMNRALLEDCHLQLTRLKTDLSRMEREDEDFHDDDD